MSSAACPQLSAAQGEKNERKHRSGGPSTTTSPLVCTFPQSAAMLLLDSPSCCFSYSYQLMFSSLPLDTYCQSNFKTETLSGEAPLIACGERPLFSFKALKMAKGQ